MSRGFAAAQRHLGISAANISVHIGQLERRLGVRLCDRGRKGFRLTEEGRVIYDAALTLFRATDHFRSTVGSTRGRLVGEIHFGFVDAVITNPALKLEETIATFTRAAPDTQLNLDISSPQELVQGLLEERYHVVLSPQLERRDGLAYVPFREERKSLYCGRTHPLFKRADGGISLEELADTPAVARSYMSEWLSVGSLKLHNSATASHVESLALMILSGCFIGHLPDHYAARWVAAGEMRPLLENKISYVDWFHLAYRSNERNRTALAFIDILTGRIRPNDAAAGRATKSPPFAARPRTISR
jgi:LysR family transcriptional regulator, transcriptional activator for bauABCD operon